MKIFMWAILSFSIAHAEEVLDLDSVLREIYQTTQPQNVNCDVLPTTEPSPVPAPKIGMPCGRSKIPFFQSNSILDVSFDVKNGGLENKGPATFHYKDSKGVEKSVAFTLEGRKLGGHGRGSFCETPMLRVVLPKKTKGVDGKEVDPLDGTVFDKSNRGLKLYLPCKMNEEEFNVIRREYALYQAMEATGVPAYKTRFFNLTTTYGGKKVTIPAYIMEDTEDLGKRCKAKVEVNVQNPEQIEKAGQKPAHDHFMPFLNYCFIRNWDYFDDANSLNFLGSNPDYHNYRVLVKPTGERYGVPMDFDNSYMAGGLFTKSYAPSEDYGKKQADDMLKYIPWNVDGKVGNKSIPNLASINGGGTESIIGSGDDLRIYRMMKVILVSRQKILDSVTRSPMNAADKKAHLSYYIRWFQNAEKAIAQAPFKE